MRASLTLTLTLTSSLTLNPISTNPRLQARIPAFYHLPQISGLKTSNELPCRLDTSMKPLHCRQVLLTSYNSHHSPVFKTLKLKFHESSFLAKILARMLRGNAPVEFRLRRAAFIVFRCRLQLHCRWVNCGWCVPRTLTRILPVALNSHRSIFISQTMDHKRVHKSDLEYILAVYGIQVYALII